jgi:predicted metal-dependent phosphoesterase TrpH
MRDMATKQNPLLCELHAHTTWSDGLLSLRELCDLYGRRGFDVLAVTDHTTRDDNCIREENFDVYLESIVIEAKRALCL